MDPSPSPSRIFPSSTPDAPIQVPSSGDFVVSWNWFAGPTSDCFPEISADQYNRGFYAGAEDGLHLCGQTGTFTYQGNSVTITYAWKTTGGVRYHEISPTAFAKLIGSNAQIGSQTTPQQFQAAINDPGRVTASCTALPNGSPICDIYSSAAAIASSGMQPQSQIPAGTYTVTADAEFYLPNQKVTLTMTGPDFRGILFYAAPKMDPTAQVGSFEVPAGMQNNANVCNNSETPNSSLTHTARNSDYAGSQTFTWIAPPQSHGEIHFHAVILQKKPDGCYAYAAVPCIVIIKCGGGRVVSTPSSIAPAAATPAVPAVVVGTSSPCPSPVTKTVTSVSVSVKTMTSMVTVAALPVTMTVVQTKTLISTVIQKVTVTQPPVYVTPAPVYVTQAPIYVTPSVTKRKCMPKVAKTSAPAAQVPTPTYSPPPVYFPPPKPTPPTPCCQGENPPPVVVVPVTTNTVKQAPQPTPCCQGESDSNTIDTAPIVLSSIAPIAPAPAPVDPISSTPVSQSTMVPDVAQPSSVASSSIELALSSSSSVPIAIPLSTTTTSLAPASSSIPTTTSQAVPIVIPGPNAAPAIFDGQVVSSAMVNIVKGVNQPPSVYGA
ncbi:hypothetical protein BC830DRAFT_1080073 [Chytriomyces sp. MP71]|nr:hypothetical protein BC830DRAFT_1080073 [Chytriomyces sp. MP71]